MSILKKLKIFYKKSKIKKGYIGRTFRGKKIPYFVIEKSTYPKVIVAYSIHAREYITTYLALEQIKDFAINGKKGTVYFVPCVNLDGVEIALNKNPLYKANYRKVDLNVNFDAKWGKGEQNTFKKSDANFIGKYPFSEKESTALRDFTLKVMPDLTISYHSKGEEIYYEFFQDEKAKSRDEKLAQAVAKATGYQIKSTPNSSGGYKDWCIERLKIPALTIEVGNDRLTHPIKKKDLPQIVEKNIKVLRVVTEHSIWKKSL